MAFHGSEKTTTPESGRVNGSNRHKVPVAVTLQFADRSAFPGQLIY